MLCTCCVLYSYPYRPLYFCIVQLKKNLFCTLFLSTTCIIHPLFSPVYRALYCMLHHVPVHHRAPCTHIHTWGQFREDSPPGMLFGRWEETIEPIGNPCRHRKYRNSTQTATQPQDRPRDFGAVRLTPLSIKYI